MSNGLKAVPRGLKPARDVRNEACIGMTKVMPYYKALAVGTTKVTPRYKALAVRHDQSHVLIKSAYGPTAS